MKSVAKRIAALILALALITAPGMAANTQRGAERPLWMDDETLVVAGSWHTLAHRARLLDRMDFMLPVDGFEAYRKEQSAAVLEALKRLGVNCVTIPCYEGYGYLTERLGMGESRKFAELARRHGMRVGAHIGGTLGAETLFKETPEARQWVALQPDGQPALVDPAQPWRYAAARNHPAFIEHLRQAVKFAVEELKADLLQFGNFGPGNASWDLFTVRRFQDHIAARGHEDWHRTKPPAQEKPADPLSRAWRDYQCESLAEHFRAMSRYAHSLNTQCATVCSAGGVGADSPMTRGVNHAQLLPWGNAFWDESPSAGCAGGRPVTRIRSLKTGLFYNNATLVRCQTPLDVAESMAFNLNCLGMIAWFENGSIASAGREAPGPVSGYLKPYVSFFRNQPQFFHRTTRTADVAVLRCYETFASGSEAERQAVFEAEQSLIESQTPFAIIYDRMPGDLSGYRTLVVPDQRAMSKVAREETERCRLLGAELLPAATLAGGPARARERLSGKLCVEATAPPTVAMEIAERRGVPEVLVHLVNYNVDQPVIHIPLTLRARRLTVPVQAEYWNPLERGPVALKLERKGAELRLKLPRLDIYGLVVVRGAML